MTEPASCMYCAERAAIMDRYCGRCGKPLSLLQWRGDERGEWSAETGMVAVKVGEQVKIHLGNNGRGAVGVALLADSIENLPPWIDHERLEPFARIIQPRRGVAIPIPMKQEVLKTLFAPTLSSPNDELKVTFELQTSLFTSGEGWVAQRVPLQLIVARQPSLSPAASLYPFIPRQRLQRGLRHTLTLTNEAATTLILTELPQLIDPKGPVRSGMVRILSDAFATLPQNTDQKLPPIAAQDSRDWEISLNDPRGLPQTHLGYFQIAAQFVYRLEDRQPQEVRALIEGVIGPGPELVLLDDDSRAPFSLNERQREVRLFNPGAIPVTVTAIESLRGGRPIEGGDWLELSGIAAGDQLDAGEIRVVTLRIDDAQRPRDEEKSQTAERLLRLHHDGWQDAPERVLEWMVDVAFEPLRRVRELYLGIDFGTTNSTVCLFEEEEGLVQLLDLEEDPLNDMLPSLMFCGPQADHFSFGKQAERSRGIRPENLVRSIKSIVSQRPSQEYRFVVNQDGRPQHATYTAQELLNRFIAELRRRAEIAAGRLERETQRRFGLTDSVRFERAIFTHPVMVAPQMRKALMAAAHACDLNTHLPDLGAFEKRGCIDEATAAVLAYIQHIYDNTPQLLTDKMQLLCIDIGGGTSDIAIVRITDSASFLSGAADKVQVTLQATAGLPNFGGDRIDRQVVHLLLEQIRKSQKAQALPIAYQMIKDCLTMSSLREFQVHFKRRYSRLVEELRAESGWDFERYTRDFFGKTDQLKMRAEQLKRTLSAQNGVNISLLSDMLPAQPGAKMPSQSLKLQLLPSELVSKLDAPLRELFRCLERLQQQLGWSDWCNITHLMFVGQSSKLQPLTNAIEQHVRGAQGGQALQIIHLQQPLSPKNCVALGAAVWGSYLRHPDNWIEINNLPQRELTADIQLRSAPRRYQTIQGLKSGTPYPARGTIRLPSYQGSLTLYQTGKKLLNFHDIPDVPLATVVFSGPRTAQLYAGDACIDGELV